MLLHVAMHKKAMHNWLHVVEKTMANFQIDFREAKTSVCSLHGSKECDLAKERRSRGS